MLKVIALIVSLAGTAAAAPTVAWDQGGDVLAASESLDMAAARAKLAALARVAAGKASGEKQLCIKGKALALSDSMYQVSADRERQIGYPSYRDYEGLTTISVDQVDGVEFYDAKDYRLTLAPGACFRVDWVRDFGAERDQRRGVARGPCRLPRSRRE